MVKLKREKYCYFSKVLISANSSNFLYNNCKCIVTKYGNNIIYS